MLYNYEPIFDATSVSQAYAKDMIIVGKTNMDEFAMGGSNENSAFKPTKMLGTRQKFLWFFRWFGGTSSAGQVRLSLGSDTGGSIRQPAFNGIVGMKPTYGTVSRFGLIAFGSSLDQIGPFSQTVKKMPSCSMSSLVMMSRMQHQPSMKLQTLLARLVRTSRV